MKPKVIIHNAISVDGRTDGFEADIGLYIELASHWQPDAMLTGSNTMLKSYMNEYNIKEGDYESLNKLEEPYDSIDFDNPEKDNQYLILADSRGRIRFLNKIRKEPYWKDVIILCSKSTPAEYLDYLNKNEINHIIAGDEKIDFKKVLPELKKKYQIDILRVDSGGTLNAVLLNAGLVDELSLILYPCLVGSISESSIFKTGNPLFKNKLISLDLIHMQQIENNLLWLIYKVSY